MNKWKKLLQWLNNPKWYFLLPIILIAVGTTISSSLILTQDFLEEYMVLGFILLGIAGVTLSYSIFGIVRIYPKAKEHILKWAEKYPRIDKMFKEYGFTTLILTVGSMFVTLAFAIYNGSIAIIMQSIWFGALAAYYIVLVVLRGSILIYYGIRKRAVDNGQPETQTLIRDSKLYRACGILLFLLPVCLSFAMLEMVLTDESFVHKGFTIYVYAAYAFFKIITAVYSLIKERRNNSMVIMAIKSVKLADAFVSILALQMAMYREFSAGTAGFDIAIRNCITGAVVCALTVAIGVYMIVKAGLRMKKLRNIEAETEMPNITQKED